MDTYIYIYSHICVYMCLSAYIYIYICKMYHSDCNLQVYTVLATPALYTVRTMCTLHANRTRTLPTMFTRCTHVCLFEYGSGTVLIRWTTRVACTGMCRCWRRSLATRDCWRHPSPVASPGVPSRDGHRRRLSRATQFGVGSRVSISDGTSERLAL